MHSLKLAIFLNLGLCLYGQTQPPIIINPQYLFSNPTDTQPSTLNWGSYKYTADWVPPFNYEFFSINIGGYDFHNSSYTPRGSSVASSSALMVGWNTPTDADCILYGCQINNGQAGITVGMMARNHWSPTVGLMLDVSPGIDNYNGIWGFNVNISNAFHTSNAGFGMTGGEINYGLDDGGTDVPNPGYPGQLIGLTITESSMNHTGKRASAAINIGTGGTQNAHHGVYTEANSAADTAMDDVIGGYGPVTTPIDLSKMTTGPTAISLPPGGGLALGTLTLAQVALYGSLPPGLLFWCPACVPGGSIIVSTGKGFKSVRVY